MVWSLILKDEPLRKGWNLVKTEPTNPCSPLPKIVIKTRIWSLTCITAMCSLSYLPMLHSLAKFASSLRDMKLKQLEALLGDLQQFSNPKVEFEQYPTGPHIASRMIFTAENSFGDVSNKVVADFGCGCGTLSVAAALLGAEHVMGIDIDLESLVLASVNAGHLELDIDFIQYDVNDIASRGKFVDTIIMNPPFGTRKKGADMVFLSAALKIASQAVYSLHKTSTRDHVKRAALQNFNASSAEVLCELRYDLPRTYKFHKKKEVDIAVDLWRFVPAPSQGASR